MGASFYFWQVASPSVQRCGGLLQIPCVSILLQNSYHPSLVRFLEYCARHSDNVTVSGIYEVDAVLLNFSSKLCLLVGADSGPVGKGLFPCTFMGERSSSGTVRRLVFSCHSSEATSVPIDCDRHFAQPACSVDLRYMPGAQIFIKRNGSTPRYLGLVSKHPLCVPFIPRLQNSLTLL